MTLNKWRFVCDNWWTTQQRRFLRSYECIIVQHMTAPGCNLTDTHLPSQGLEEWRIASGYDISESQISTYGYCKYSRSHKKCLFNGLASLYSYSSGWLFFYINHIQRIRVTFIHIPSMLLHWHWGNLTIAPVPAKWLCRIFIKCV